MTRLKTTSTHRLATGLVLLAIGCGSNSPGDDGASPDSPRNDGATTGDRAGSNLSSNAAGGSKNVEASGTSSEGGTVGSAGAMGGGAGTGGASGKGGTSPDGGGGAPTGSVTVCPNLPATGKWQRVSPPGSDYTTSTTKTQPDGFPLQTDAIAMRPDDAATIYVGVNSGGFYRSNDCGTSWTLISTDRNADKVSTGAPWSLAIDPVTPDVIYNVQGYGASGLWKTTNAGVDWDQIFSDAVLNAFPYGGATDSISIDPTDHQHLVSLPHGGSNVAESTDAGATWRLVTAPAWGENSSIAVLDKKTWLYCDFQNGLYRTADEGASFQNVTPQGAGAVSCNYYSPAVYRSENGMYYLPAGNGVIKSPDGISWSLIANSGGRHTNLVETGDHLIAGDQWSLNYYIADENDPTRWTALPQPTGPSGQGASFMLYDKAHLLLYSSNFNGGLWQLAIR